MTSAINAYLATLPAPRQAAVGAIVATVRRAAPGIDEAIQYNMPCFTGRGRMLSVASQKSYISVYLCSDPGLAAELRAAQPRARGGKACVNFPDGVAVPLDALATIVARELA